MSAKSDDLLPSDELDPEDIDDNDIIDDDDLLFEAVEALKDGEDEELDTDDDDLDKVDPEVSLDILAPARGVVELGDDPVRLYLKDIGSIELLDVNHEFWLAARMDAIRRLDVITRQHPTASRGGSPQNQVFRALYEEFATAWKRAREDIIRLKYECPDFLLTYAEARRLRQTWQSEEPSYLRTYLDNGLWGRDPFWNEIAKKAFLVFISLYALPDETAEYVLAYLQKNSKLPPESSFVRYLPPDDELRLEISKLRRLAYEAHNAIIRANLRLVVSVAKRYIGRGSSFLDL
ncbi:MAG TPA: hypothetical protein DEH25_09115, partial [Chloroflexi bacterium]|nr:hypothetical protein [Chloroflexota bacterium]